MSRFRKRLILERASAVPESDEGLECKPELLLYAFELVGGYATGKSHKAKLENRMELALSLVDWAISECDRGLKLLELSSQMAISPRPQGPIVGFP
jgi:hypothetical protein